MFERHGTSRINATIVRLQLGTRDFIFNQLLQLVDFACISRPQQQTVAIMNGNIECAWQQHLEQLHIGIERGRVECR